MHILIIEDNPADSFLTRLAVKKCLPQAEVITLEDGELGMDYLTNPASPGTDLILLDLNLPRVDGLTFLRWLRARPDGANLPVFILSSAPADAIGQAALEATKYLEKPAMLDEYFGIGKIVCDYLLEQTASNPREAIRMAEEKKCAHPSCNCKAKEGSDYCGAFCEGAGKTPDVECSCGHPECMPAAARL